MRRLNALLLILLSRPSMIAQSQTVPEALAWERLRDLQFKKRWYPEEGVVMLLRFTQPPRQFRTDERGYFTGTLRLNRTGRPADNIYDMNTFSTTLRPARKRVRVVWPVA
ncbi:MAG: hypothetical protein LH609_17510 [Rudanella sp.]|nr:hypothetical protein [Rudanella sp.]